MWGLMHHFFIIIIMRRPKKEKRTPLYLPATERSTYREVYSSTASATLTPGKVMEPIPAKRDMPPKRGWGWLTGGVVRTKKMDQQHPLVKDLLRDLGAQPKAPIEEK